LQQSSTPAEIEAPAPRRRFRLHWQDWLSIAIVAVVAYKLLIAPRTFGPPVPAPALVAAQLDGPRFDLSHERGHVVFLDFFASWCEPCKISLPLVERYARDHPQSRVYTVDVGDPLPVVRSFARSHHLDRVVIDSDERIAKRFGVDGFPTMIVVDADGAIRTRWAGLNPAIGLAMQHAQSDLAKE